MRGTLRDGLAGILTSVGRLAQRLLFAPSDLPAVPALRGKMRTAVVIPAPDERFAQAVFILRDEPLRESGVSRAALLEQAAQAAEEACAAALPRQRRRLRPGIFFLLGCAAALALLGLLGLL